MNAFLPGCRRSVYWLACALPLPLLLLLQPTPGDTIPGGIRPPGQRLEFEGTVPFHAPELEVEWKVPAGSLPKEVSIYRRADGLPSPTTLASLLQFAGLEQARPVTNHAGWVVYQDSAVPGRVQVDAGSGRVQYFDPTREESPGSDTIPGVDELDGLLREWIDRLGLPLSEFKTNTQGRLYKRFQETETTSYDRATGGHVTRVTARGVSGIRQAGGWSMGGRQQISLKYGPDGRLLSLELDWLRLEQVAVEPVAGSRQILEW
ncbi:MAG: hypothetical protein KDM81_10890, partial [Verrucomicrobiae bacterium]|nr:hypothetical protein [Verrucomicrobiae bacterium]